MAFRLFIAGCALGGLVAPAFGDTLADEVDRMPSTVEDVRIVGNWEDADRNGVYRVIVARDHGMATTARLFIQWIAFDGESAAVDQSVEIADLAELDLDVIDYNAESDLDGLSLYLETLNPSDGLDETYELHIFSPTEYLFGPATN